MVLYPKYLKISIIRCISQNILNEKLKNIVTILYVKILFFFNALDGDKNHCRIFFSTPRGIYNRNYHPRTLGVYTQITWNSSEVLSLRKVPVLQQM